MSGRTSWWSKDAAWHRRERIVELGETFGSAGPMVLDVLSSWAQEQRSAEGSIRGGYRALAREAFCSPNEAEAIVNRAAAIGALDDLEVAPDGRRFTCRVSGWQADQARGKAAWRQQEKRARDVPDQGDPVTPRHGTSRDVTRSTPPDQTRPDQERETPAVTYQGKRVPPKIVDAALHLLGEFNAAASRNFGSLTAAGQASPSLKQIIGALLSRPEVEVDEWERAIANTIANPPSFVEGDVQLGHIFGPKAAEYALANTGKTASIGAARPPGKCPGCGKSISSGTRCNDCARALEERLTGAAA